METSRWPWDPVDRQHAEIPFDLPLEEEEQMTQSFREGSRWDLYRGDVVSGTVIVRYRDSLLGDADDDEI